MRSLADEVPFDIPDSWEWVRLGSAFAIEMGQSPAGNTVSGNCSGTEFHQGKVFFGEKCIKASDQYTYSPTKFAPENSVLLCVRAPVGKVNITDRGLCIGRGLCAIIPLAGMPLLFAYYLLAAYENIFVKQATGTTFFAITAETVKNQLIPMPPLAEQQRIADLIERLIPYVDEYGKAESAVDQLNCHFPEALKKSYCKRQSRASWYRKTRLTSLQKLCWSVFGRKNSGSSKRAKSKKTSTTLSFSDGIILIMRSWTVWSAVSTMNCPLKYPKTGNGVALAQLLQCWVAREFLRAEN